MASSARQLPGFPPGRTRREFGTCLAAWATGGALPSRAQAQPITEPRSKIRVILDTDAGNSIDDQFALAYAALSPERIELEAVYAAPFVGRGAATPAAGMRRSYAEIRRVLDALGGGARPAVLQGARGWVSATGGPARSPAAADLIEKVGADGGEQLYIVALGAPTNVASALLIEPSLAERAQVVWLGGSPHHFPSASEFNLRQDPEASRTLFDSRVRLMHVPAPGLAEYLLTSREELARFLPGQSRIGDYLFDIFLADSGEHPPAGNLAQTRPVWDLAPVAWLVNPKWMPSAIVPSPDLTKNLVWRRNAGRHSIRVALRIARDPIFADLFRKIAAAPA